MRFKGIIIIFLSLIICTFLYILAKPSPNYIISNFISFLAQITALWGTVLFCLTFLLGSRLPFLEKLFGSLDKIYKLHQITGRFAMIFLIFHFLFLALRSFLNNGSVSSRLVIPIGSNALNVGILSLWSLVAVIAVTIYLKTEYEWFVKIQRLFIIPLGLGVAHMLLISSDSSKYFPLTVFLVILAAVAVLSWFYKAFLYGRVGPKLSYTIESFRTLDSDILEIILKPDEKKLEFLPGQFVYIMFEAKGIPNELHPFSMASSPDAENLRFVIKTFGNFTNQMKLLKAGDRAEVFGPYGSFSEKFLNDSDAVLIAGGIGITPFLSMIGYLRKKPDLQNKKVDIFYCVKNEDEAIFMKELDEDIKDLKNLSLKCVMSDKTGFLTAKAVKEELKDLNNKTFFLCAPFVMMDDLTKQFVEEGVSRDRIIFEDFNFR